MTEEKKKIGFLEKWNEPAQKIEFSITRLQMAVITVFALIFTWYYFIVKGTEVTWNNILLIVILFAAGFSPKILKDIIDKVKSKE